MAYCHVNQFQAKKLLKIRGITNCNQVESIVKSSAFLACNNFELLSNCSDMGDFTSLVTVVRMKAISNRRCKLYSYNDTSASDSDQGLIYPTIIL